MRYFVSLRITTYRKRRLYESWKHIGMDVHHAIIERVAVLRPERPTFITFEGELAELIECRKRDPIIIAHAAGLLRS